MNPSRFIFALLLFISGPVIARTPIAFHYLAPNSVNLTRVLSGPPAADSAANKKDIQDVLTLESARTPEAIARVRSEEKATPANFANVLGPWFTPEKLPMTFALLENAAADAMGIAATAKDLWHRPRPPLEDFSIHPVLSLPSSYSYPSAHAMRGVLWADLLAQFAPNLREHLLARGAQIGQDRVLAGVHFPSDVAAGQKLGAVIAGRLLLSPAFQHDFASARAEFDLARSAR